jgi:hypothetical protein
VEGSHIGCDRMDFMSVTLDLKPDLQARAQTRAAERGLPLEAYLETVLEEALSSLKPLSTKPSLSLAEFDAIMDEMAEGSEDAVPPAVFSREGIYADHD